MNQRTPILDTNDLFNEALRKFDESATCERLREKYRLRAYWEKYSTLFHLCRIAAYIIAGMSILTACGFIIHLVPDSWPLWIAVIIGLMPLVLIEAIKRELIPDVFSQKFQFGKINKIKSLACAGLFGLSVFLSFKGAGIAIQYLSTPPTLVQIDSVKQPYLDQLETIETTKAMAAKMTWLKSITRKGQAIIKESNEQATAINMAMFKAIETAETRNTETLKQHTETTQSKAIYGAYLQLVLELLLLACLYYCEVYDWRSIAEFAKPRTARFVQSKEPAPPINVPEPPPVFVPVSAQDTRPRNIAETAETPNVSKDLIQIEGFKAMTVSEAKSKISQYRYKIRKNIGKAETNRRNIMKLEKALM